MKMSTIAQIAESLKNIFDLFVKIGYLDADGMKLPPHSEDVFDIHHLRLLGMNNTAIEFIKNIPWYVDETDDLIVNSELLCWQVRVDRKYSRELSTTNGGNSFCADPATSGFWLSLTRPVSSYSDERRGNLLVIDTSNGETDLVVIQMI